MLEPESLKFQQRDAFNTDQATWLLLQPSSETEYRFTTEANIYPVNDEIGTGLRIQNAEGSMEAAYPHFQIRIDMDEEELRDLADRIQKLADKADSEEASTEGENR